MREARHMDRHCRWIPPVLIALLGVALALVFSLVIYPAIRQPLAANIDPDKLGDLSSNLADGRGFVYSGPGKLVTEFDRGPVYPAVVAEIILLGGTRSFLPVQVFQSLLHGLTCFVVFLIASRIHARKIALASEALCAIHPMLIWYTARIWIETTHTLLVTVSLFSLLLLADRSTPRRAVASGLLLGLASLTKSILLPFSFVAGAVLLLRRGRQAIPAAAIMVIVCLLVVLPWTVRNYLESGYFIPVHTSLGLNRVQGDAIGMSWSRMPFSTLDIWQVGKARIDSILEGTGATAVDPRGDRILTAASLRQSMEDPGFALKRTAVNLLTFCYMSESRAKSIFLACIQFPLFLCALVGSYRLWKRAPLSEMGIVLLVFFFVVHALVVGWARYSVPVVPVAIVLAFGILPFRNRDRKNA
jgi:4-amino-4-deoxy-L-arabinose transferase-like glycosyltransferase